MQKTCFIGSFCLLSVAAATTIHDVNKEAKETLYCNETFSVIGYDEGFFFEPGSHGYALKINGLTQNRFVLDRRQGDPPDDPYRYAYDFENTRNALNFSGYLAKHGFYNLRMEFGAYDSGPVVDWGYGGFFLHNGLSMSIGQMRIPTLREWTINDEYQLAIARGYTTSVLFDQQTALQIGYEAQQWRLNTYIANGLPGFLNASGTPNFYDSGEPRYQRNFNTVMGAMRVEWLVCHSPLNRKCIEGGGPDSAGRITKEHWALFNELTNGPKKPSGLLLGLFASYTRMHIVNLALENLAIKGHLLQVVLDLQANFAGGSLYAAAWTMPNWLHEKEPVSVAIDNTVPFGALIQGGFYPLHRWELFARYEYANWREGRLVTLASLPGRYSSIVTGGTNFYLVGQHLKVSLDVGFSFEGLSNHTNYPETSSTNWLNDSSGRESQLLGRFQLQAFF